MRLEERLVHVRALDKLGLEKPTNLVFDFGIGFDFEIEFDFGFEIEKCLWCDSWIVSVLCVPCGCLLV